MTRLLSKTGWAIVAAFVVVLLTFAGCMALQNAREAAGKARGAQVFGEGRTAAAGDASAVRDDLDGKNAATRETVNGGVNDVRNAETPARRNDAALRGLCAVDPSSSPDCRLL
jgi:hypothetical protein